VSGEEVEVEEVEVVVEMGVETVVVVVVVVVVVAAVAACHLVRVDRRGHHLLEARLLQQAIQYHELADVRR